LKCNLGNINMVTNGISNNNHCDIYPSITWYHTAQLLYSLSTDNLGRNMKFWTTISSTYRFY
jgi:hypothetical protein